MCVTYSEPSYECRHRECGLRDPRGDWRIHPPARFAFDSAGMCAFPFPLPFRMCCVVVVLGVCQFDILGPIIRKNSGRTEEFTVNGYRIRVANLIALSARTVNNERQHDIVSTNVDYLDTLTVPRTSKPSHDLTLSVVVHLYSASKRFSDC